MDTCRGVGDGLRARLTSARILKYLGLAPEILENALQDLVTGPRFKRRSLSDELKDRCTEQNAPLRTAVVSYDALPFSLTRIPHHYY